LAADSQPDFDKELALFKLANHHDVIKELKDRQWQLFRWTIGWYASIILLALNKPDLLWAYDYIVYIVVFALLVAFVAFCFAIYRTQEGLKDRRTNAQNIKNAFGAKFDVLKEEKSDRYTKIMYDCQIWGTMIILNFMAAILTAFIVLRSN